MSSVNATRFSTLHSIIHTKAAAVVQWMRRWIWTKQTWVNSHWYPYEPISGGRKSSWWNCSHVPVKSYLPW